MTDAELKALKAWVDEELAWHADQDEGGCYAECVTSDMLRIVLALLAKEAQRGEVVPACPKCRSFAEIMPPAGDIFDWYCSDCDLDFTEPAYYQRIPTPRTEPTPETT